MMPDEPAPEVRRNYSTHCFGFLPYTRAASREQERNGFVSSLFLNLFVMSVFLSVAGSNFLLSFRTDYDASFSISHWLLLD